MLSEYRKLVYADGRYNDNTLSCAYVKSILLLEDFFLKIFDCLCVFIFVSFWSCLFFASLHIMKSRGKKEKRKKH